MTNSDDELWGNSKQFGPNTSESVAESLEFAISQAALTPRDVAAVSLARRYAADIDTADVLSVEASKLLRAVGSLAVLDPGLYGRLEALFGRIERVHVLGLLGPKLQAVMTDLGLSPRARNEYVRRGGESVDDVPRPAKQPEPGPVGSDDLSRVRAQRKAARFNNS